jgi:gluconolactonase
MFTLSRAQDRLIIDVLRIALCSWFILYAGKQLQVISFPAMNTTSCCFGGPDYTELYVTTANWNPKDEYDRFPDKDHSLAGSIFRVTGLGVHGFAAPTFDG